jgi:hypothetical protein
MITLTVLSHKILEASVSTASRLQSGALTIAGTRLCLDIPAWFEDGDFRVLVKALRKNKLFQDWSW